MKRKSDKVFYVLVFNNNFLKHTAICEQPLSDKLIFQKKRHKLDKFSYAVVHDISKENYYRTPMCSKRFFHIAVQITFNFLLTFV